MISTDRILVLTPAYRIQENASNILLISISVTMILSRVIVQRSVNDD